MFADESEHFHTSGLLSNISTKRYSTRELSELASGHKWVNVYSFLGETARSSIDEDVGEPSSVVRSVWSFEKILNQIEPGHQKRKVLVVYSWSAE